MSEQGYEQLTLFPADFLASHSAQLGNAEAVKMTVTSGQRCSELLRNCGPVGLLVKMLLESSTWHSTRCFLTWKVKATKQGRLFFQLAPSMPRTGGTELQLLGTPTATMRVRSERFRAGRTPNPAEMALIQQAEKLWPTPTARDYKGANSMEHLTREGKNNHTGQLANAVKLWPTPTARSGASPSQTATRQGGADLQTAVLFPTPTTGASLCGGAHTYQSLKALEATGEITPEERRSMAAGNGGQLNPKWVEAMMGFPPGWTELEPDGQTEPGRPESHE